MGNYWRTPTTPADWRWLGSRVCEAVALVVLLAAVWGLVYLLPETLAGTLEHMRTKP